MKKAIFILCVLFAFGCSPSPVSPSLLENEAAKERSAGVNFTVPGVNFTAGQTVEARFFVSGFSDITCFHTRRYSTRRYSNIKALPSQMRYRD